MKYVNAKSIIKSTDKQSSEKNDCSVRAFATALDVNYDAAHSYVKEIKKVVSIWNLQGERSL